MPTLSEIECYLRSNRRLAKVLLWVDRNSSQPLSLGQAARIAGLERTYFCNYFQDVTGITFRQWDRVRRIEQAKRLLLNSHPTIKEIAASVGYSDGTTFARNFRRCETVSPRIWRSLHLHARSQRPPLESQ